MIPAKDTDKQEGDKLVCQNCGNSFTMDQVGEISRGCDPWPILDENKTVTDEEIEISYDFLKASADIFRKLEKGIIQREQYLEKKFTIT